MTETLSFPGLGLSFDINRVAFNVLGRPIYWYGILIATAFLAGAIYVMYRTKAFGLDPDRVMDAVLGGVLLGIVGARLYYVAFSWDTYKDNPLSILNIRLGGVAIYGGIIGAVIAAILVSRWRNIKPLPLFDLATAGLLLGQGIGRWGNFINIEAFGSNTTAKWGMTSSSIAWYLKQHQAALETIGVTVDPNMPVHPTFFYESIWCLLGFGLICWYTSRRKFDGELSLIYIGWYGLGRLFIEGLRTDSLMLGSIRISQMVALLCVIASVLMLIRIHAKIRRSSDPDYRQLYVNTDEGKAVLAGTFYKTDKPSEEAADQAEESAEQTEKPADQAEETAELLQDTAEQVEETPDKSDEPADQPDQPNDQQ